MQYDTAFTDSLANALARRRSHPDAIVLLPWEAYVLFDAAVATRDPRSGIRRFQRAGKTYWRAIRWRGEDRQERIRIFTPETREQVRAACIAWIDERESAPCDAGL